MANTAEKIKMLNAEIDRLRGVVRQHWNFAVFVDLWVNRDNVTDAERVDVIKHHPSLKRWMGDEEVKQPSAGGSSDR